MTRRSLADLSTGLVKNVRGDSHIRIKLDVVLRREATNGITDPVHEGLLVLPLAKKLLAHQRRCEPAIIVERLHVVVVEDTEIRRFILIFARDSSFQIV